MSEELHSLEALLELARKHGVAELHFGTTHFKLYPSVPGSTPAATGQELPKHICPCGHHVSAHRPGVGCVICGENSKCVPKGG